MAPARAPWLWRLAALCWAAAMAWGCLQEASGAPPGWLRVPHIDKLAHGGMHAVLAWLLYFGVGSNALTRRIAIVFVCAGYGLSIEWGQWYFTLTRSAEAFDVLANSLGAIMGVALASRARTAAWRPRGKA